MPESHSAIVHGVRGSEAPVTEEQPSVAPPVALMVGFDRMFARRLHEATREAGLLRVAYTAVAPLDIDLALDAQCPAGLLLCWESANASLLQVISHSHPDVGIVVLAQSLTYAQACALMRCGALAAVERADPPNVVVAAMTLAAHGMAATPRRPIEASRHRLGNCSARELSVREIEVLGLLECGESVTAIARLLGVSFHTARSQARSLYRKLGIHTRADILDPLDSRDPTNRRESPGTVARQPLSDPITHIA